MAIALVVISVLFCVSLGFNGYFAHKYKPWTPFGKWLNGQIDKWQG